MEHFLDTCMRWQRPFRENEVWFAALAFHGPAEVAAMSDDLRGNDEAGEKRAN
jgi:hypothetical protein